MLDIVYREMKQQADMLNNRIDRLTLLTESAGEAFSFPISTLANAPLATDGMSTFACRFISDGRKTGEGAGSGTGVPAYYDPTSDSWLLFRDDSAVLI